MTRTVYICLHTNQSRSNLNHLVAGDGMRFGGWSPVTTLVHPTLTFINPFIGDQAWLSMKPQSLCGYVF